MTQKINGKFYPLQLDEWVQACKELKPAELKILYYLRCADPYNNGSRQNAATIGRQLKMSRQTVSRAIKELDRAGYIDTEPLEFNVRILAKGLLFSDENVVCPHTTMDRHTPEVHGDTTSDRHTPTASATHHPEPETPTPEQSRRSKNIKIDSDESKTLSESERENFDFWNQLDRTTQLALVAHASKHVFPKFPNQIALPEEWTKHHCVEIYSHWQTSQHLSPKPTDPNLGESSEKSLLGEIYGAKDWEIAPGVPYPAFKEERIAYWCHKGEPIEAATAKAGADLRNPQMAADLWEGFLRKCDRLADEALKAQERGCTPYFPPSFTEKVPVTKESVAAKLQSLGAGEPFRLPAAEKSIPRKNSDWKPTIEELNKALLKPTGETFTRDQIESNPHWGYAIVDGKVVEVQP